EVRDHRRLRSERTRMSHNDERNDKHQGRQPPEHRWTTRGHAHAHKQYLWGLMPMEKSWTDLTVTVRGLQRPIRWTAASRGIPRGLRPTPGHGRYVRIHECKTVAGEIKLSSGRHG